MASQAYKRLGLLVVWLACFPGTADAQFQAWANQWGQHAFNAQAGRDYLGITNFHPGLGVTFTLTGPLHYTISANGVTFSTNALFAGTATNWLGSNSMQVQITSVSNSVVTTSNSLQTQVTVVSNSLVTTSNVLQSQVTGLTNAFQTNAWHLNGNTMVDTNSFIGSVNNVAMTMRVNNTNVIFLNTNDDVVIGRGASAGGGQGTAIGRLCIASGLGSLTAGYNSQNSGLGATVLGNNASASAQYAIAIGGAISVANQYGIGIGANVSGDMGVAIGFGASCSGEQGIACGPGSTATGFAAFATPYGTANGVLGIALGPSISSNDGSLVANDGNGAVTDDVANQFAAGYAGGFKLISAGAGVNMDGPTYSTNKLTVTSGYVMATNFITSVPKWIDININYALSASGPTAPSLVSVTNPAAGSLIKQLAFDNNDELFGQCQLPHNLAVTNSAFPAFYTEPHVHFDCKKAGVPSSTASNVTWRIEWEWANINGTWSRGTNQATMGITNNYTHYMLELGHITNNPPLTISAVFRCRLTRPASAAQEYDPTPNSHEVILDAFDLHVPVGNTNAIGSSSDNAP